MNVESATPILTSVGFGMISGFLIGFAIKKVMKILAVVVGIFLAAMIYLETQKIISINWTKLQSTSEVAVTGLTNAVDQIQNVASSSTTDLALPLTGSLTMGLAIGFMKG